MRDCRNKDIGVFLISAYAPIGVAKESEWQEFFSDLDDCIAKRQGKDILVIGSDTNSSMGYSIQHSDDSRHSLGRFGLQHVNDAGRRFLSYLAISNLLTITTCFRKKTYATWIHPRSKLKHQIDHFFVGKDKSRFFHRRRYYTVDY